MQRDGFSGTFVEDAGPSEFARAPKLTDSVTAALRNAVLSGEWEPGEKLPNARDLAERFGVSAPTLREAVRALESIGLVEVRHGSGMYVALSAQDLLSGPLQTFLAFADVGVEDVITLRIVLARFSIVEAVRHAADPDIQTIIRANDEVDRVGLTDDWREVHDEASRFERLLSAAARNPLLHGLEVFLIESLHDLLLRAWSGNEDQVLKIHRQSRAGFKARRHKMVKALDARDEAGALDATARWLEYQKVFYATGALRSVRLSDVWQRDHSPA